MLSELEKYVIKMFIKSRSDGNSEPTLSLELIEVAKRTFSGVGFITEISKKSRPKILKSNASYTGSEVLVRINGEEDTGYIPYIRDGFLEAIEGHTYSGHPWPDKIDSYSLV